MSEITLTNWFKMINKPMLGLGQTREGGLKSAQHESSRCYRESFHRVYGKTQNRYKSRFRMAMAGVRVKNQEKQGRKPHGALLEMQIVQFGWIAE